MWLRLAKIEPTKKDPDISWVEVIKPTVLFFLNNNFAINVGPCRLWREPF